MSGVRNVLSIVGITNPTFSNGAAAETAAANRLANSPNRPADGGPHDISEPPRKFWARNLGALAGHTIHQTVAAGLARLSAEFAGLAAKEAVDKHPAHLAMAQAGILLMDLCRVAHMVKKAFDPATQNDANIAYAGMSDRTADGKPADASRIQRPRLATALAYGGMVLATDAAALAATVATLLSGKHDSEVAGYAKNIAQFQARNLVYAMQRDFVQTVFHMVGGGGDNLTFHQMTASKAVFSLVHASAGVAMDVVSPKLADNKAAYALARAALNTIPEIIDWFVISQKQGHITALHEGPQQLQHWSPGLNQHLRNGDLKKFLAEVGHKLTDQSVARLGFLEVVLVGANGVGWLRSADEDLHHAKLTEAQKWAWQIFMDNAIPALLICAIYPQVVALMQAQGAQRGKFVESIGAQPSSSGVTITELLDIEAGGASGVADKPGVEVHSSHVSAASAVAGSHSTHIGTGESGRLADTGIGESSRFAGRSNRWFESWMQDARKPPRAGNDAAKAQASESTEAPILGISSRRSDTPLALGTLPEDEVKPDGFSPLHPQAPEPASSRR